MNHYYLVSSLPTLTLGERPEITRAEFLQLVGELLDPSEVEALRGRFTDAMPAGDDAMSRDWRAMETALRNACARQRAARLGVEARSHLRDTDADVSVETAVASAFNARNPLERERALDAIRWAELERLAGFDPFTPRALQCYALRLHLAWRWAELDAERGRATARRLAGMPAPEPAGVPTP